MQPSPAAASHPLLRRALPAILLGAVLVASLLLATAALPVARANLLRLAAVEAFLHGAVWNPQADPLGAAGLPAASDAAALRQAEGALAALRATEPLSPGMARLAALVAAAQGDSVTAARVLDEAQSAGSDPGLAITRAALLAHLGDPAQTAARRAAAQTPERYLSLIETLLQLDTPDAALLQAERATTAFPAARALWHMLGNLQRDAGDTAAALTSYRRGLDAADARARVGASNLLYAIGRLGARNTALMPRAEAEASLRAALARNDFGAWPAERSDAHFQLGHIVLSAGDPAEAAAAYEAAIASAVTVEQGYLARVSLANALWSLDRREDAIAALEKAMPIEPQRTEAPLMLAQMAAATGDLARARALYADVLALDPDDATAQRGAVAPESVPSTLPAP